MENLQDVLNGLSNKELIQIVREFDYIKNIAIGEKRAKDTLIDKIVYKTNTESFSTRRHYADVSHKASLELAYRLELEINKNKQQ